MAESTGHPAKASHFAKAIVFNASKSGLMRSQQFRQIANSKKFTEEFLPRLSAGAPHLMKPHLEKALEVCKEASVENKAAKKERKRAIEERIQADNKRQKRTHTERAQSDAEGFQHPEYYTESDRMSPASKEIHDALFEAVVPDEDTTSQVSGEESEKELPESPCAMPTTWDNERPSRYERQLAIVRGEPKKIDDHYCRVILAQEYTGSRTFDVNSAFEVVLTNCCMKLDPEFIKDSAGEFLDNRLESPGAADFSIVSEESPPEEILSLLRVLKPFSEDAMIRCAFAQIMLYLSVKRQVDEDLGIPDGKHKAAHLNILQELAAKKAGAVSEKEYNKIYYSYERDYFQGKKWKEVVEMFGGSGIVVLFVVAGVGSWYVASRWTKYQRECLAYLSTHLYGIRRLVASLGPKALERYCRCGYLGKDCVERVAATDTF